MSHTYTVCSSCHGLNKVDAQKGLSGQAVCGKCQSRLPLHGLVTNVNNENLHRILAKSDIPVVVDFWADWCGPCKMYGPEFEKASSNTNAVFLKVNTEEEQSLSAQLGIRGIPCTVIFKNGREVRRQAGAMNSGQLKKMIESV